MLHFINFMLRRLNSNFGRWGGGVDRGSSLVAITP